MSSSLFNSSYVEAQVFMFVKRVIKLVSAKFGLKYKAVKLLTSDDPEHKEAKGLCTTDGEIYIAIRTGSKGKFDTIEEIIDTSIHELAHIKYPNHSKKFWQFHRQMKKWFNQNYL